MKIVKFIEGSEVVLRKLPNKEAEKFVNEGKGHFVSRGTWRQYQNTQKQIEGVKSRKNNKFIKPFGFKKANMAFHSLMYAKRMNKRKDVKKLESYIKNLGYKKELQKFNEAYNERFSKKKTE